MLRRVGLAAIIGVALATPSAAIVSNPLPRICNEFPHSDYVFSGKVLSEGRRWHRGLGDDPATVYRIRVDHVFKGKVPHAASLYTPNNSGRGVLTVGQPAIVFAQHFEGRIVFTGSSNSQSGSSVSKVIAELRTYLARPPKVATISGRIDGWVNGPMAPLQGARLLMTNGETERFLRADRRGMFHVPVPPGRWSVQIAEPGWASRTGGYSYDSAEDTRLGRGGCADLQIETARPNEKLEGSPQWKRWPG